MLTVEIGFLAITLFIFGAIIGSFLHVIAERYGSEKSAWRGQSVCPNCKKTLSPRELVPIFSYLFQRAKCASCRFAIPYHYPLIETLSGFMAVALLMPALQSGASIVLAILLLAIAYILIILIRIDSKTMMLPDGFIILLGVFAILYVALAGSTIESAIFGMLAGAMPIYMLWAITGGRGIGFGDVKLMIALGMLLGAQGAISLLFFAFFIGGIVGIFLLGSKKATAKTAIPFGPFLAGSALLLMVFPGLSSLFFAFLGV